MPPTTLSNITVYLARIGWNEFYIADLVWTSIILPVGAIPGILRMRKDNTIAYGMVLIRAYLWMLFKPWSADTFSGQYPGVIATLLECLILFEFLLEDLFIKNILIRCL